MEGRVGEVGVGVGVDRDEGGRVGEGPCGGEVGLEEHLGKVVVAMVVAVGIAGNEVAAGGRAAGTVVPMLAGPQGSWGLRGSPCRKAVVGSFATGRVVGEVWPRVSPGSYNSTVAARHGAAVPAAASSPAPHSYFSVAGTGSEAEVAVAQDVVVKAEAVSIGLAATVDEGSADPARMASGVSAAAVVLQKMALVTQTPLQDSASIFSIPPVSEAQAAVLAERVVAGPSIARAVPLRTHLSEPQGSRTACSYPRTRPIALGMGGIPSRLH